MRVRIRVRVRVRVRVRNRGQSITATPPREVSLKAGSVTPAAASISQPER